MAASTPPETIWRDELMDQYAGLAERLQSLVPCLEIPLHLPWIDAINRLKKIHGAVIMAHNCQSPEIFNSVADVTGDSLPRPRPRPNATPTRIAARLRRHSLGAHFRNGPACAA